MNFIRTLFIQDKQTIAYFVLYLFFGVLLRFIPIKLKDKVLEFKCICGYRFLAPLKDYWRFINANGHFESKTICLIKTVRINSGFAIDIGAHIGIHTVHMAFKGFKVIAVEPHPYNLSLLISNIRLNNVERNVLILPIALNNFNGKTKLYIHKSTGGHSLIPVSNIFVDVYCRKLDNISKLTRFKKVDLVKIDVEGSEVMVLMGGKHFIRDTKPNMLIIETTYDIANKIKNIFMYNKITKLDCWNRRCNYLLT